MELLVSRNANQPESNQSSIVRRPSNSSGIINPAATLDLDDTGSIISDISKIPRVPGDGAQAEDVDHCSTANLELRKQERLPTLALQQQQDERCQSLTKISNGDLCKPSEARGKSFVYA
ncbi:hypothetical protein RP20_CCG016377 [Aedes albopictus]|nr:hypothetical protein RP20_CCG016377 [Aedes albopictus]